MPFLAGRGAWPSALSRARSLRLSERSGRPLTEEAGGPGAGFQQEGQEKNRKPEGRATQIWGWRIKCYPRWLAAMGYSQHARTNERIPEGF